MRIHPDLTYMLNLQNIRTDPREGRWEAHRLIDEPIIHADLDSSIGENIQGPSLVRVPDWIPDPLGRYYLYFADHKGKYIRLAYADQLEGPWSIHAPGALHLRDSCFPVELARNASKSKSDSPISKMKLPHKLEYEQSETHIASPDVHVDRTNQKIVMYFHGLEDYGKQVSRCATSTNGLDFITQPTILSPSYLRVLPRESTFFATTMPGVFYRSKSWFGPFESIGRFFNPNCRHMALCLNQDVLYVFWTEVGDAPEQIKVSWFDLETPTDELEQFDHGVLLEPDLQWEGADEPLEPSVRSVAYGLKNQLRDPAIYVEDDVPYLLYAGGGESAIGIARLEWKGS